MDSKKDIRPVTYLKNHAASLLSQINRVLSNPSTKSLTRVSATNEINFQKMGRT